MNFLQQTASETLQFEAAWALTNIASSDRTEVVVEYQAVPFLVQLMLHTNPEIREQCAWCLGNVAGDGSRLRDVVLHHGAIGPIITNLQNPANLSLLRNCTWTLSNLCRGKPQPPLALLAPALPILASVVFQVRIIHTLSQCDANSG